MSGDSPWRSIDPDVRGAAVAAVASRGILRPGEMEELLQCLADPDKRVQRGAADVLALMVVCDHRPPRLASLLDAVLRSDDRRARWGAAYCLARGDRASLASVSIWIEHLACLDRDLRWAAHDLLVRHAPGVGGEALSLLRTAASGGDGQRRKMALYCLRDIGDATAVVEAIAAAALAAADIEVRLAAFATYPAVAVERRKAARSLCEYLGDADPRVRRAAAVALGKMGIGDDSVLRALEVALQSTDPALQRAARGALSAVRSG